MIFSNLFLIRLRGRVAAGSLLVIFLLMLISMIPVMVSAQPATPIPVNPPTATATLPPPTDIPTGTPTSQGPASAQALTEGTNVRSQPDIEGERVGAIGPNATYPVLGRRFEWYQINFPEAPGGTGWVHQSVVTILGDPALIPDFSLENLPTEDSVIANARATADAITATPGGFLTATALAQQTPEGIFTAASGLPGVVAPLPGGTAFSGAPPSFGDAANMPTYTFPAQTPTPLDLNEFFARGDRNSAGGMPPIMPILALGSVGLVGVLISFMRKL